MFFFFFFFLKKKKKKKKKKKTGGGEAIGKRQLFQGLEVPNFRRQSAADVRAVNQTRLFQIHDTALSKATTKSEWERRGRGRGRKKKKTNPQERSACQCALILFLQVLGTK